MDKIKGYKGFNKNLQCRDFQYKINGEYEEKGNIKTCSNGFHFCEEPFDVFSYYPPCSEDGENRYCEVEGSGNIDRDNDDSKIASSKIKIKAKFNKPAFLPRLPCTLYSHDYSFLTGISGYQSAATNTGYRSAAIVNGEESIAIVTGYKSKAKGCIGSWLVLTERDDWDGETYPIKEVKAVKVDGCNIKKDTFYMLINGKVEKVE